MKCAGFSSIIITIVLFSVSILGQAAYTPEKGTPERRAILDALLYRVATIQSAESDIPVY